MVGAVTESKKKGHLIRAWSKMKKLLKASCIRNISNASKIREVLLTMWKNSTGSMPGLIFRNQNLN